MGFMLKPLESVGNIKFGMATKEIQGILGKVPTKFIKAGITNVDDFGFCHVFYDNIGTCVAVELFSPSKVIIDDLQLMGRQHSQVESYFLTRDDIVDTGAGFISPKFQLSIYTEDGVIQGVCVGSKEYFNNAIELLKG